MPDIIEFVRLITAAKEVDCHPRHLHRVLTSDDYRHLDPRPTIYRPNGGYNTLVRHEPEGSNKVGWESFKRAMLDDGLKRPPKKSHLMESRRLARLERERQEGGATAL